MESLSDRIPEPTTSWTQEHDPNPLEGIVATRREVHSEKLDKDFTVLEVGEANGRMHDVPCGRADLASFVRRFDPQVGDHIALKWWGLSGPKNVYTGVSDRVQHGRLEIAPELTDDDFVPDE